MQAIVTIHSVFGMTRAMPENQQETASAGSSETIRQPSDDPSDEEMVRSLRRRREAERNDRPADKQTSLFGQQVTGISEIPCRVDELPVERVISRATPANNGETLTRERRAIPWEVESDLLFDPVTTEAKAEMAFLPRGKSMNDIRRRPSKLRIDVPSYISGYVDGEGCFCVSLRPQSRIRIGWEVRPSFSVSQNGDRAEVITLLPRIFGCGSIRPDRSDRTLKYEVRSLEHLVTRVIPFFEVWPLQSSKHIDFLLFSRVCHMMRTGAHLSRDGILSIAQYATRMNSGTRKYTTNDIAASFEVKG